MKNTITVDFKNIISELKSKELKLCFVKGLNIGEAIFIEDAQGDLFSIAISKVGSYLDRLIMDGVIVVFNYVDNNLSQNIKDYQKEVWGISEVKAFIKRQKLQLTF
ncbi:UNVERIFIED_CONTAM: hypothetical protein ABIC26_002743 [Paenibacillus sp. PvR008]